MDKSPTPMYTFFTKLIINHCTKIYKEMETISVSVKRKIHLEDLCYNIDAFP